MLGRNPVDVVAAARLQLEHDGGQLARSHLAPGTFLAGLPVLAEDAAEVAPAEEDVARAVPAAQAILLAEVGEPA